jgi:hypothetical protein
VSETTTHRRTRQLKGQLTDLKLRNLETRDKPYKVADGNGLFVLVSPSGLRAWRKVWAPTKHQRYSEEVLARLERNVFPVIGHKPVSHIEPKDIVRMMDLIQGRGATDIARRVRNTCSQVFRFAVTKGLRSRNPAGEFKPSDVLPQIVLDPVCTAGDTCIVEGDVEPALLATDQLDQAGNRLFMRDIGRGDACAAPAASIKARVSASLASCRPAQ